MAGKQNILIFEIMTKKKLNSIKAAAQAVGFYENPIYKIGDLLPEYFEYFAWQSDDCLFCYGKIRESKFLSYEEKIAYLQGALEDTKDGHIIFANSPNKARLFTELITDVGRKSGFICPVLKTETLEHTAPRIQIVYFDMDLRDYIVGYKFNFDV